MVDYLKEYEKIKADVNGWCKIDLMNIGERAMQSINKKQWIVARLHDTKRDREKLLQAKFLLRQQKNIEIADSGSSPVSLNKSTLEKMKTPDIETIEEQIKDCEFLIRYLEDMVKMFMFIAQDIKNIIDSIKLETE